MEKLKMHSPNLTQDNIAHIRDLFPGCVTEAKSEDGSVKLVVDFDQLRQELAESVVEGPQERYHLNWPGKREALLAANAPIAKTLRPCREESVDFDDTKNLFIEGDNLDALKLLQENYLGRVKVIYIDPPYNTGSDLVYRDDFATNSDEYLKSSNQVSTDGGKLVVNTERNGRFHSDWLSFMYPRLKIARTLLKEDGVIMISIDDSEVSNLKSICSEIFGESNFVASLIWEKGRKNDAKLVSVGHEYILLYCKNKELLKQRKTKWREAKPGAREIHDEYLRLRKIYGKDNQKVEAALREFYDSLPKTHPSKKHSRYNKVDEKGVWRDDNMSWPGGDGPRYEVLHPVTGLACAIPDGGWRYSTTEKMQEMINQGKVVFREDHSEPPIRKTYLIETDIESAEEDEDIDSDDLSETDDSEDLPIQVAGSYFYRSALQASSELTKMFGSKIFSNPKDREVLARWINYVGTEEGDVVLDFFAGSGTTGHAVMQIAATEKKNLRFILVQLPEAINPKAKGAKSAIKTLTKLGKTAHISEITKERLCRAGTELREIADVNSIDVGFRVFKIDTSNMADVYYTPDALHEANLDLFVDNIKPDRTPEDLLFQVMLDWGVDLSLPINKQSIQGKDVFFVDDNVLAACFDASGSIDEAFVKELAKHQPLRVVFRDAGYKNSAAKINVEQIFKLVSPVTEVKCI
ncbi:MULTISPECIES: site-specific DNA-methyltransferase [Enterobacterales]|uniref:site-specific DNA-methyltransferase n=2 Tax=Gammaproteobacteria TaxID=1236 RepID=UPI0015F7FE44|nr:MULTISPECIES: site-specific DNA-methyltransferase [Enterobacterales]EGV9165864.1 site-specific DNA-methyltransferase [Escherichia coli]HAS1888619.1 site-specific DNA-methyltransferase [Enterobacter hormaechei subsp. xiangfangensis]MBA7979022.1 site-specific DNA-methyltransferase [Citrobacter freundii]MDF3591334.1 site-specific DNA-methyltransferase [Enterobacter hormaechei]MDP8731254.1 site-specific DNA-methyltransferase [Serratia marcescens]